MLRYRVYSNPVRCVPPCDPSLSLARSLVSLILQSRCHQAPIVKMSRRNFSSWRSSLTPQRLTGKAGGVRARRVCE